MPGRRAGAAGEPVRPSFQSVLCGIVQYRLTGMGVEFKNANREAIRIFGYEPEEFWQKKDWNMPLLIAEEDRRAF